MRLVWLYHSLTVHRYQSLGWHQISVSQGSILLSFVRPRESRGHEGCGTQRWSAGRNHWRNLNNLDLEMFTFNGAQWFQKMCFRVFTWFFPSPHPCLYRSSWIKSEQGPVPSRSSMDLRATMLFLTILKGFLDHLPIQVRALKAPLFFPLLPLGQANLCRSSPLTRPLRLRPARLSMRQLTVPALQKRAGDERKTSKLWVCENCWPPNPLVYQTIFIFPQFWARQSLLRPQQCSARDLRSAWAKLEKARAFWQRE